MITAGDLADQVEYRVSGKTLRCPRRLWSLMAGPEPDPGFEGNGCGPKLGGSLIGRMLTLAVPDELHGWSLAVPCFRHDYAYGLGGTWRERREADWNLARNIVTAISEGGGSCSAPRIFTIATLYWLGVRLGGWCAWTYGAGVPDQPSAAAKVAAAVQLPVTVARLAVHAAKES